MNPDLRKLIALQDIDLKIAVLYKQVSEIPLKISELEAAQQRVQSSYEEKAALTKNLGERRRLLEGEVDLARTRLSRLKEQLMAVKPTRNTPPCSMRSKASRSRSRARKTRFWK